MPGHRSVTGQSKIAWKIMVVFSLFSEESLVYEHITDIKDFPKRHNRQPEDFFIHYNEAEDKEFVPLKLLSATQAKKLLGKELH